MAPQKPFSSPDLSVVILCYRSGKEVQPFVDCVKDILNRRKINFELVLVGNYLPEDYNDETPATIKKLQAQDSRRIKIVAKPKEGMMGWDMRSGLEVTTGPVIAVIDGDGQMPPEDLVKTYDVLAKGGYDLVKTYRQKRYDSLWRRTISPIYNVLFTVLFPGTGWRDINSKPKIFTRKAYDLFNLHSDDWFIDAEIMIQARRLKMKVAEVTTVFHKRTIVRPVLVKADAIFEFIKNLIKARIREFKLFKRS